MKELTLKKQTPQGEIKVVVRIISHLIYIKFNQNEYTEQILQDYKNKGIKIRKGLGWLEIDLFGDIKVAKLGDFEIDLEEDSIEQIEEKLSNFYLTQYIKSGFTLE